MCSVNENIKKYYSNTMCIQCNNDICKAYGGRCRRYERRYILNKIIRFIKGD